MYVALKVECAPFSITSVTSVGYCCRSSLTDGFGEWDEPSEGDGDADDGCELNSTRNLADLAGPIELASVKGSKSSVSSFLKNM